MRQALSLVKKVCEIGARVDASNDTRITAKRIAQDSQDDPSTWGRAPVSIAAASLYVAAQLCDEHITQREIADAAGIARETIRDNYPAIVEHAKTMDSINTTSVVVPAQ